MIIPFPKLLSLSDLVLVIVVALDHVAVLVAVTEAAVAAEEVVAAVEAVAVVDRIHGRAPTASHRAGNGHDPRARFVSERNLCRAAEAEVSREAIAAIDKDDVE